MAATQAVVATYELLGTIIPLLPAIHIARIKRICSSWATIIEDSSKIRRAGVLVPDKCNRDDRKAPIYPKERPYPDPDEGLFVDVREYCIDTSTLP